MFEVYEKASGKTVETETHPYFKGYELMLTEGGLIAMLEHGSVICFADSKLYGARMKGER